MWPQETSRDDVRSPKANKAASVPWERETWVGRRSAGSPDSTGQSRNPNQVGFSNREFMGSYNWKSPLASLAQSPSSTLDVPVSLQSREGLAVTGPLGKVPGLTLIGSCWVMCSILSQSP